MTIEIPEMVVKAHGENEKFKDFHQKFLVRHPLAKSLAKDRGQSAATPKAKAKAKASTLRKRLHDDFTPKLMAVESVPAPEECLGEVPIVNARANAKLTTMPILMIDKKNGPTIKNETGQEAFLLALDYIFFVLFCSKFLSLGSVIF